MTSLFSLLLGLVFQPSLIIAADRDISAAASQSRDDVVVELFASQHCPACPKAHKTMQTLQSEQPGVFILTWSVNYWDYLGEPDPLAIPEARTRQDIYAENMGLRGPYTPQSVYNGIEQCSGARKKDVMNTIEAEQNRVKPDLPPAIIWQDSRLTLPNGCTEAVDLVLVDYLGEGEHDTEMVNPVLSSKYLGTCEQDDAVFEIDCDGSCAVLLQRPGQGEIIKAVTRDMPA